MTRLPIDALPRPLPEKKAELSLSSWHCRWPLWLGFWVWASDLGKLYVVKSELQNSADACALAAARELSGANTNQLALAEGAGIAAGMRHDVLFHSESVALAADDSVKFSPAFEGAYQSKAAMNSTERS